MSGLFAAPKLPPYPVKPANDYANKTEKSGITLAAKSLDDLGEQKIYFGTELTSRGFIPVFVVIENQSRDQTFLFDQTTVGYGGAFYDFTPSSPDRLLEYYVSQKIKSKTLPPGGSVHGFLYVPVPKKGQRPQIHLQVPITASGASDVFVLNLVF